jgi:hypothetical protein
VLKHDSVSYKKVKLPLSPILKRIRGIEVWLHLFYTSAINRDKQSNTISVSLYLWEITTVPIELEAEWAPAALWTI